MERATLYAQGTIWTHGDGKREGDLVMIVSNSAYNAGSATVNCLTVARKQQGVCVPLQMDKTVYVQCEQLVTVPVKELAAFRGVASAAALSAVQGKLKAQLGIADRYDNVWAAEEDDEAYREELTDLRARIQRVEDAALRVEEAEAPEPATETPAPPAAEQPKRRSRKKAAETAKPAKQPRKKAAQKAAQKAAPAAKQPRAKYSPADIAYITNTANSISDVVAKYGFRNKNAAYMVRSRLKKAQAKAEA